MDEFIRAMATPQFWLSVVLVTVVLNVVSHYLIRRMDGTFSSASTWWAQRSAASKKVFNSHVAAMRKYPALEAAAKRFEVAARVDALLLTLIGLVCHIGAWFFTLQPASNFTVRLGLELSTVLMFGAAMVRFKKAYGASARLHALLLIQMEEAGLARPKKR